MPSSPHPSYEFIATGLAMVDASGAHVLSIVINRFENLTDRGSSQTEGGAMVAPTMVERK